MNDTQLRVKGWIRVYNHEVPDLAHDVNIATRRVCSQSEHSCRVTSYTNPFYWKFRCSHGRYWFDTKCAQCERIGISRRERSERWNRIVCDYVRYCIQRAR